MDYLARGSGMQFGYLRRREFIALLGGAATWPIAARGQQASRLARVGYTDFVADDDSGGLARARVFGQGMEKLGWKLGHNLVIDYRWNVFDAERARRAAAELLRLTPDVILCAGTPATLAFKQATSTVPIVFASVSEPVAQGIVQSLANPGGNLTGFSFLEPTIGAKWLDLLKQIAPRVKHVALMFNPTSSPYSRLFFQSIETTAPTLAVEAVMAQVHNLNEVEQVITRLGLEPDSGLIASAEGFNLANRKLIIELAARHRVPAIYGVSGAAFDGGLIHYTLDIVEEYGGPIVTYVDKVLRGVKPADLPVQQPTRFSLVVNAKTASALGLTVPQNLLISADEVIE
jgi:putative ABC transport system substrate-binding protein